MKGDEFHIRLAFVPAEGCVFIVGDYEQVEMRIMADRSGDPAMLEAIRSGKDLHSFTVSRMMPQYTYEEVVAAKKSKEPDERQLMLQLLRQDMKAVGFGIIYGAGAPKISTALTISDEAIVARLEQMGIEKVTKAVRRIIKRNPLLSEDKATIIAAREDIANEKIQDYFRTFPYVKAYMDNTIELCACRQFMKNPFGDMDDPDNYQKDGEAFVYQREFGFVQTLLGRYRRLEEVNNPNRGLKGHAEREAVNVTIQGSASELTKAAMKRIEFDCPELQILQVQIINQVHDELVLEVPKENAEEALPWVKECMEHPFEHGKDPLQVPIPVELNIADSWGKAK